VSSDTAKGVTNPLSLLALGHALAGLPLVEIKNMNKVIKRKGGKKV